MPLHLEVARDGIVLHDDGTFAEFRGRVLMTGPQPEVFAQQDLQNAGEMLRVAQLLVQHSEWRSAADRAYYAMFYAAHATLWGRVDRMPHTHNGVQSQFTRHLVRTGKLDSSLSVHLGNAWTLRLDATYKPAAEIQEGAVRATVARAEAFVARVRELLASV